MSQTALRHYLCPVKRIGLLSDTHGFFDPLIADYFSACDEIWHAGDIGSADVASRLADIATLRAVSGNIDGTEIRKRFPERQRFYCEQVSVLMTHIGGYPGRYARGVRESLLAEPPRLFVCGHSHILKVMHDKRLGHLCLNPGAAGRQGIHKVRTLLRFVIEGQAIKDMEVIEMGPRA